MQRIIGIVLGAIVTYLMLVTMDAMADPGTTIKYGTAVVVGAIVSMAWPWVIGFILVRRAKARRNEQIDKEVDKRISQGQK